MSDEKPKKKDKRGFFEKFTNEEAEYIRINVLTKTDVQLAKDLNRDLRTIRAWRRKLGIHKDTSGRIISSPIMKDGKIIDVAAAQPSQEDERAAFFQRELKNSLYYENLKQQFSDDEIAYYLEEWGSLCVQFEDIIATEKRQIDEFIKAEIIGNRIMRNVKTTEDIIKQVQKEIEEFRRDNDVVKDEKAQARDQELLYLVRSMASQADAMTNDYQNNVSLRNKLLSELNARRTDRIESIKKSGTTFAGLVQAFRDKAIKEAQGRQVELVRIAKEKKLTDWRKINTFPDGSKDCIIFDDKSEITDKFKEYMDNPICGIVQSYQGNIDKTILIIEDDHIRKQFLQDLFKGHKITFASNFYSAKEALEKESFNLICFDYDIGLDLKGDVVAQHIVENNLCSGSDVLIHSMNKSGAESIAKILSSRQDLNIEVFSFENLLQAYHKKEG